jgi:hypothetical protein
MNTRYKSMMPTAEEATEQDEAKYRRQSSTPIRRGMGFANMLEASWRGTFEIDEDFKRDSDLGEKSGVRRGMGFANMLEASRKGT